MIKSVFGMFSGVFGSTEIQCLPESTAILFTRIYWNPIFNYRNPTISVLQLGFKGRGVPGRTLFVRYYKNEGALCHVMCLVSRHVTKYNPFLNKCLKLENTQGWSLILITFSILVQFSCNFHQNVGLYVWS